MLTLISRWAVLALCINCSGHKTDQQTAAPTTEGTTIVDLSDNWAPYIFAAAKNRSSFKKTFVDLANSRPVDAPLTRAAKAAYRQLLAPRKRSHLEWRPSEMNQHPYLDVYGIPPTLSELRKRAKSEVNRPCFREADTDALRAYRGFKAYSNNSDARQEADVATALTRALKTEMTARGFATLTEYRANTQDEKKQADIDTAITHIAIEEIQKQLICEGLLDAETAIVEGGLDYPTHLALRKFEQKNRIFGWGYLGPETIAALAAGPGARLYDALKRVAAARVADATGIVEDGTAMQDGEPATYLDENGNRRSVPNLVETFTDAVLHHLGVTSKETALSYLTHLDPDTLDAYSVEVRLPPLPPYYAETMPLAIEIDRGDVFYDFPYDGQKRRFQKRDRLPTLTLYTTWRHARIPLATYPTTIGGWQNETAPDGYTYLKYKSSPAGQAVIQEIIAAPTWMPPESTPIDEIVKRVTLRGRAVTVPDMNAVGPWYASAYGLVAAVHLERGSDGQLQDKGIRSHGSHDYTSILKRYSHGCHRLFNHLAIRLYDFVLRHTPHQALGPRPSQETRPFTHEGRHFRIDIETDGEVFRLETPLPVETLPGRLRGHRREPLEGYLPRPDTPYGPDATFLRPAPVQ